MPRTRLHPALHCLLLGLLFAVLTGPEPAAAWSAKAHQVVARVAAANLSKTAKARVEELLGAPAADAMAAASTWADDIVAKRPETAAWHFVNIPASNPVYKRGRDCPQGNCAVAQIGRQMTVLGDMTQPRLARVEALRFLINLTAEIHQPLRCADDGSDHGRNARVSVAGRSTNLFDVWEKDVPDAMTLTVPQLVSLLATLITREDRQEWRLGSVIGWCEDSARISSWAAYDDMKGAATLNDEVQLLGEYPSAKVKLSAMQMNKAGIRLAALLNHVLK